MFCMNCGKELQDDAKFCTGCGTPVSPAPQPAPSQPLPAQDQPVSAETAAAPILTGKKHKGSAAAFVGIAAVVIVAIIAIVAVAAGGLFSSPKVKVGKAVSKSLSELNAAQEKLNMPDLAKLYESQKVSESMSFKIEELSADMVGSTAAKALEGFGLRLTTDVNVPGREMAVTGAGFYGSADLISGQLIVDDANIYVTSPEFLDDTFFGLNTETLGVDLDKLDVDMDDIEKISFNIFDMAETITERSKLDKEAEKALTKATKEFVDAITVEKTGKSPIDVNGTSTECTAYHVLIPQDAMEIYVDALADAIDSIDREQLTEDILVSMGFPDDVIDEAMDEVKYVFEDVGDMLSDAMEEVLDVLGDLEADVYIKGGYVMAVTYETKVEGVKIEAGLYLGGGKNYADDLSLEITAKADGESVKITMESTGDHTAKSGVYTDETTIRVREDSYVLADISSELRYEPKAKEDNFSWIMEIADVAELEAVGHLETGKDSMSLNLEEIAVSAYNRNVMTLSCEYSLAPYSNSASAVKDPLMLSTMDEDAMMDLGEDIQDNAYDWLMDLVDEFPELQYMF